MSKRTFVIGAATALLAAASGAAATSAATAPPPAKTSTSAPTISTWYEGVRAGTTRFVAAPGAACQPKTSAALADRRCKIVYSGRFTAKDRGYRGTYSGSAFITYLYPDIDNYAAFDNGSITYRIWRTDGTWLGKRSLQVDSGTGGVAGFPGDMSVSFAIEERNEPARLVLRMSGDGFNALGKNLSLTRTYLNRIQFQSGI